MKLAFARTGLGERSDAGSAPEETGATPDSGLLLRRKQASVVENATSEVYYGQLVGEESTKDSDVGASKGDRARHRT